MLMLKLIETLCESYSSSDPKGPLFLPINCGPSWRRSADE
jgi:hypothetical protein